MDNKTKSQSLTQSTWPGIGTSLIAFGQITIGRNIGYKTYWLHALASSSPCH